MGLLDLFNAQPKAANGAPLAIGTDQRTGSYTDAASTNPYAPRTGLLGLLLGENNPAARWAADNRSWLSTVGSGIANGLQMGDLGQASANDDLRRRNALDWSKTEAMRSGLAKSLSQRGFTDLADALAGGYIDANEAFRQSLKLQADQQAQAQEDARNKGNAQFLADPTLREMVAAGALDFKTAYDMQTKGGGGPSDLSLTPQWVIDPKTGQKTIGQLGKDGKLYPTDLGGYQPIDPMEMAAGRTGATVDAKTAGAARAALPGAEQAATIANKALDLITGDSKGLSEQFGNILGIPQRNLPVLPGSSLGNWQANFQQAKGQAFLQAREMLKGGGQITDVEGAKAEAAFSRMDAAAATGDLQNFLLAAEDFRQAVADGLEKLRATAAGAYGAGQPATIGGSGSGDPLGLFGGQ